MWRTICSILLTSQVFAQSTVMGYPEPSHGLRSHQGPCLFQYTYYSHLRQGTRERVAIKAVFIGPPGETFPAILPVNLTIEANDGLVVTNVEYPKSYGHTVQPLGEEYKATNGAVIKLQIRADKSASLGTHLLKGKLTFKVVTSEGMSTPETVDIQMPITLVAHNVKVSKTWPYHHEPSKGELILLAPLLVIAIIPLSIACTLGFRNGCF